jgi:F0F1-type ATP synthase epsilon subunit
MNNSDKHHSEITTQTATQSCEYDYLDALEALHQAERRLARAQAMLSRRAVGHGA